MRCTLNLVSADPPLLRGSSSSWRFRTRHPGRLGFFVSLSSGRQRSPLDCTRRTASRAVSCLCAGGIDRIGSRRSAVGSGVPERRRGRAQENDDAETARLFEETHAAALTYRTDYFLRGASTISFHRDSRRRERAPISQAASPRRCLLCSCRSILFGRTRGYLAES